LFGEAAKSLGKEIVAELYTPANTNDFAPYIEQVKNSGAGAPRGIDAPSVCPLPPPFRASDGVPGA
jgi:hypothetical protein